MEILALFGWFIVWLLAMGIEKLNEKYKQKILDENPYWLGPKSEKYLRKHGLTFSQSTFQCTMRRVNKDNRFTPEETARRMGAFYDLDLERYLTDEEKLQRVIENWDCLKEIDEKPEYRLGYYMKR